MTNPLRMLFSTPKLAAYARRWPRILMSEPARLTLASGEISQATLIQISAGGARVQVHERLRSGDLVGLDFNLAPGGRHSVQAMVIYTVKEHKGFHWICGLSFVDTNPTGDKRIAEFVREEHQRRQIGFAMPRN